MSENASRGKHYTLRYLDLFLEDLSRIVDYISHELENPMAADNLVNAVEDAIQKRSSCAEAFEQYPSKRDRQYPYYRIYVKNYTVFYVVIGNVMEVRRILYSRRDLNEHI
ncbi:MAG: type II toxin-antitoxin system RelE/ParE family toxin [Clostridiaceae bacterium]|nr:type II toxin-antitoxin system RelE/ParE family toxin [Clostridiaceae bacterium]